MAKRTNIIRILEKEIEKGNEYIDTNGNSINADKVEADVKDEYLKALKNGTIEMTVSWMDYLAGSMDKLVRAETVIQELANMGLARISSEPSEPVETSSEPSEPVESEVTDNELTKSKASSRKTSNRQKNRSKTDRQKTTDSL